MLKQSGFLLVLTVAAASATFEIKDMLCTKEFCAEYIEDKGCPTLSEACKVQNSTHNGVYLPHPDVCNCCDYCLTNLAEGESCVRNIAGMLPPNTICGPGLTCTVGANGNTCQKMTDTRPCTKARMDWDERRAKGTLGMMEVRPKCDADGGYAPAHCIPGSICYCVNHEGKRIFGEIPFLNPGDENEMTCGCSINAHKARSVVEPEFVDQTMTARCNHYGLFDPLQCTMGANGKCVCVDPITGEPKVDTLVVPIKDLAPGKPSCFDQRVHKVGVYESDCELRRIKWTEEQSSTTTTRASVREAEELIEKPECQPDGKYHRVQTLGTKRVCVDPSGRRIENYEAELQSTDASKMDCNCARAKWLLSQAGVAELPKCCAHGGFEVWQCHRGECFCVNENGDQTEKEVDERDVSKLSCYNANNPCPVKA